MSFFNFFKKIVVIIVCIAIIPAFLILDTNAAKENAVFAEEDIDCVSAILMDAKTGTVLFEKNADKSLPLASVTKIMTLLLVMEEIEAGRLKPEDDITTSKFAASMGGSQVFLKEGETMSAEDMIKSVVISSANDTAVALAEHISGSEDVFVTKMNDKASSLGMINTNFENTNGLDDTATRHYSSARDIAIMSRELIKYDYILKFSSTWMDSIRNGEFVLTNTNRLVRFYPGATGLKTGSTSKAKFCISATAERNGMHLICVIMGAPSSDVRNAIATKLLNWGFANHELFVDASSSLSSIKVTGGTENECQIYKNEFSVILSKGDNKKVEQQYDLPEKIKAPIQKGDIVGSVNYYLNGELIGKTDVVSSVTIEKIDFWTLFIRILSKFLVK